MVSRKLRLVRRLRRHLAKHPNDKQAERLLQALLEGRYRWRGRSVVVVEAAEAGGGEAGEA